MIQMVILAPKINRFKTSGYIEKALVSVLNIFGSRFGFALENLYCSTIGAHLTSNLDTIDRIIATLLIRHNPDSNSKNGLGTPKFAQIP